MSTNLKFLLILLGLGTVFYCGYSLIFYFSMEDAIKESLSLENTYTQIKIIEEISRNSLKRIQNDGYELNVIPFEKYFEETELLTKDGEYYSGMDYSLVPLGRIVTEDMQFVILLKEINLIDGELKYLFVVNAPFMKTEPQFVKVGKYEITPHCETDTEFKYNENTLTLITSTKCYQYDEKEDEESWMIETVNKKYLLSERVRLIESSALNKVEKK